MGGGGGGGVGVGCGEGVYLRSIQLLSAYSSARPAILVAGKGRGGMFLFLMFLHFSSCSLWETTQNDPQGLTRH